MSEELKNNTTEKNEEKMRLDDAARVKVMSPTQLVFKRFIRNKLAVVGFGILAVMFLFSFVGPLFSPYEEIQKFKYTEEKFLEFAQFKPASDLNAYLLQAETSDRSQNYNTSLQRRAKIQFANMKVGDFVRLSYTEAQTKNIYYAQMVAEGGYKVYQAFPAAQFNRVASTDPLMPADIFNQVMTEEFATAIDDNTKLVMSQNIMSMGVKLFSYTDPITAVSKNYVVVEEAPQADPTTGTVTPGVKSVVKLYTVNEVCVFSNLVFHDIEKGEVAKLKELDKAALCEAYYDNKTSVSGSAITCQPVNANGEMVCSSGSTPVFYLSKDVVNPKNSGEFIASDIKQAVAAEGNRLIAGLNQAVADANKNGTKLDTTAFEESEIEVGSAKYQLTRVSDNYTSQEIVYRVKKIGFEQKEMQYWAPSKDHPLGTDGGGMDVMTRLMYGGRVSLMVGFVVVAIEIVIGVILGGIAGFFSGWIDVIIMRLIELFNCIPFYPMMMIIGSLLDALDVGADARIFLLMALLGILNWPGIARIVRGQILSLREQDFIVATEACGIPVSRRIFKHLIPNVIPLLIVNATMSLGGIIITEATLSFLGLGVQYPKASWGSIITTAQDSYILQSYPWIWIPAGILILLTVLGFNFVGDGLRDAFDPKMKR